MKRLATAALLIAGFAAIVPAASAADAPCLRTRGIDGFIENTDTSVVLTQGARHWKAETAGSCIDLGKARSVAAVSRGACLKAGDKINYEASFGGIRTCKIGSLTYVTPDAASN
ncbi:hypothetical protein sos41_03810 [Alphaproteobacteria bacterium SO-S41]|nr:hypothetical protein sos41_03810 [Alphaproteobacteria bacterium SO-S41]